jgi:energy-coupling factor transporter ATP-binding protein EcfA2
MHIIVKESDMFEQIMVADMDALSDWVRIRHSFERSANIRRDSSSSQAVEHYLLSAQAVQTLHRLLTSHDAPKGAWTLTGPYGSGKSSFVLFLNALLSRQHPAHVLAVRKLQAVEPALAERVLALSDYVTVLAVGRRASPAQCIVEAVATLPDLPEELRLYLQAQLPQPHDGQSVEELALRSIIQLAQQCQRPVLLVLDEMGKTLEYAVLHPEQGDLYFLQQLAEEAHRHGVLFIGVLHQAFENYTHGLDRGVRNEWAKVQGRFEDIAFTESEEQMMRLLAYAIEQDEGADVVARGRSVCHTIAQEMVACGFSPSRMRDGEFIDISMKVYPVHPISLVLLPYLFRHHAQNERSLFAYLASHEPFGFQQFLANSAPDGKVPPLLLLSHLYDYVVTNLRHAVYTSVPMRPIAEVEQTLLREVWSEKEVLVLKTVAMLQWAGQVCRLTSTRDALSCALAPVLSKAELEEVLHSLRRRSVVVYRSFNDTYRIWQGSDVDVEERLREARQRIGAQVPLAETLNSLMPPLPVAARRHSYQTGTPRAFRVVYLDDTHLGTPTAPLAQESDHPSCAGIVAICLPRNRPQIEHFEAWARQWQHPNWVIGIPQRSLRLQELLRDLACLDWVQRNTPALRDDPVARKELRERMDLVSQAIRQQMQQALRACRWLYMGEDWTDRASRSLSSLLSDICDRVYHLSPVLRNELINRWELSSAAAAGRRNLIQAMLTSAREEQLGIQGYPPERSMYETLLHATHLHVPGALGWQFTEPPEDDPSRLRPAWQKMYTRIFTDPPERVNVSELMQELAQPPYGVTYGVFPILLCAFLQVYADETSLYREGSFLPEPGIADWEVLLRRPELFAVAGCRTDGAKGKVLEQIAHRWGVEPRTVPIVRELVRRILALPEHAKRTRRLPDRAIALRQAILQAHSPEQLLYRDIPNALGTPVEDERFAVALEEALQALEQVTRRVILQARDDLLRCCALPEGEDGWQAFRQQATVLRGRVLNQQLVPLLLRASHTDTMTDEAVLESVLALIAGRPPRVWTDMEVERFPEAARVYGEMFRQAVQLAAQEAVLTPEESRQRDELLERVRQLLNQHTSERVRMSALWRLLEEQMQHSARGEKEETRFG